MVQGPGNPGRAHNPFDRACRTVLLSPAFFGLLKASVSPSRAVQLVHWSLPRTIRVHQYARLRLTPDFGGDPLRGRQPLPPRGQLAIRSCNRHHRILVLTQPKLLDLFPAVLGPQFAS